MSVQQVPHPDSFQAPEYDYTNPVKCLMCGTEWDLDDQSDEFMEVDEGIVCNEKCSSRYYDDWQLKVKIKSQFIPHIRAQEMILESMAAEYKDASDTDLHARMVNVFDEALTKMRNILEGK